MTIDDDVWFEVPDLAAEVSRVVPQSTGKATYSAGPAHLEQSGRPAALWIGVCNSPLNDGDLNAMSDAAERLATIGREWLVANDRAIDEMTVEIAFADFSQFGPFSRFNALETFVFELDGERQAKRVPSLLSAKDEQSFRSLRYRMSGRKPPSA